MQLQEKQMLETVRRSFHGLIYTIYLYSCFIYKQISIFFYSAVTVIVLLLESTAVILVLAKNALTDLNIKVEFVRQENKLNLVIHLHLLPRL